MPENIGGKLQIFLFSLFLSAEEKQSAIVVGPKKLKSQEKIHFSGKRNWERGPCGLKSMGASPYFSSSFFFSATLPQRQPLLCSTIIQQQGPGKGTLVTGGKSGLHLKTEEKSLVQDVNKNMSGAHCCPGHVQTDPKEHSKSFGNELTLELCPQ